MSDMNHSQEVTLFETIQRLKAIGAIAEKSDAELDEYVNLLDETFGQADLIDLDVLGEHVRVSYPSEFDGGYRCREKLVALDSALKYRAELIDVQRNIDHAMWDFQSLIEKMLQY